MEKNKVNSNDNVDYSLSELKKDIKIMAFENHIQTAAVLLAFIGIATIYDITRKK